MADTGSDIFGNDREVLFDLACIKREKRGSRFRRMAGAFSAAMFNSYSLLGENHEWMFFNTVLRKDHAEFFELAKEQCNYDKGDLVWRRKRGINLYNILNFFRCLPRLGRLKRIEIPSVSANSEGYKYAPITGEELALLYMRLIRNIGMKRVISKYGWENVGKLVVLYDIGEPEHFAVIEANRRGVKTAVLCHGIMLDYFDYKEPDTFNMYKIPSKYFLAIGRNLIKLSRELGSGTEVIVCGQMKIREMEDTSAGNFIGVIGNIPNDHDVNVDMIKIAEEYAKKFGMQVQIRLHPTDNELNYEINEEISSFGRELDDAAVIIGYRSSMIFTYMSLGKKVFRYDGPLPYYELPPKIVFHDLAEFEQKVEASEKLDFKELVKEYVDCIGEQTKEKYRKAFDYIESC